MKLKVGKKKTSTKKNNSSYIFLRWVHFISDLSKPHIEIKVFILLKCKLLPMPMQFVTFLSLLLDRAEIGLGGHDHFIGKANDANAISTIGAMKF